jgi:hypothetical protein
VRPDAHGEDVLITVLGYGHALGQVRERLLTPGRR